MGTVQETSVFMIHDGGEEAAKEMVNMMESLVRIGCAENLRITFNLPPKITRQETVKFIKFSNPFKQAELILNKISQYNILKVKKLTPLNYFSKSYSIESKSIDMATCFTQTIINQESQLINFCKFMEQQLELLSAYVKKINYSTEKSEYPVKLLEQIQTRKNFIKLKENIFLQETTEFNEKKGCNTKKENFEPDEYSFILKQLYENFDQFLPILEKNNDYVIDLLLLVLNCKTKINKIEENLMNCITTQIPVSNKLCLNGKMENSLWKTNEIICETKSIDNQLSKTEENDYQIDNSVSKEYSSTKKYAKLLKKEEENPNLLKMISCEKSTKIFDRNFEIIKPIVSHPFLDELEYNTNYTNSSEVTIDNDQFELKDIDGNIHQPIVERQEEMNDDTLLSMNPSIISGINIDKINNLPCLEKSVSNQSLIADKHALFSNVSFNLKDNLREESNSLSNVLNIEDMQCMNNIAACNVIKFEKSDIHNKKKKKFSKKKRLFGEDVINVSDESYCNIKTTDDLVKTKQMKTCAVM